MTTSRREHQVQCHHDCEPGGRRELLDHLRNRRRNVALRSEGRTGAFDGFDDHLVYEYAAQTYATSTIPMPSIVLDIARWNRDRREQSRNDAAALSLTASSPIGTRGPKTCP